MLAKKTTIDDAKDLMISHENMLEQRKVVLVSPFPSINIGQKNDTTFGNSSIQLEQPPSQKIQQGFRSTQNNIGPSQSYIMNNNMQSNGRGHKYGRVSLGNRHQCQVCGKLGHIAFNFQFRFDRGFQPTQNNTIPNSYISPQYTKPCV